MAKKKAAEPEMPEEEQGVPVEEQYENEGGSSMMDQEGLQHLMKGATEIMMAMEKMMPKKQMSPEIKMHAKAAKKEMLLMFRAMLDAKIQECDGNEAKAAPEPKLKKIKLD
jgi:hypothetical protein